MGRKSRETLVEEANELGIEVLESWTYRQILDAIREASGPPVEEPAEPTEVPPQAKVTSPPGDARRGFPFDALGRYAGR